jgi:hypothetical protein
MASNASCFMVTWIIFKNHLLEVGLTQNQETLAFWKLTTTGSFSFYHVWGPSWIDIHWNNIWLRARLHTTLEGPWPPHYTMLEVCWDGLWTLSFALSQCHGHSSWLVALNSDSKPQNDNLCDLLCLTKWGTFRMKSQPTAHKCMWELVRPHTPFKYTVTYWRTTVVGAESPSGIKLNLEVFVVVVIRKLISTQTWAVS